MPAKFLNGINLNNKQLTNLADGSAATDATTKQQLDAAIRGLDWKPEVVAASVGNVAIASALVNASTLDGVTLATGDRVLLKDQTAPAENGIYVVVASGAASRALDADSALELSGSTTTVQRGTVNADRVYRVTADDPITLGTTAITWVQVGAGGTTYIGGNGLVLTGSTFDIVPAASGGITVAADSISVDTAIVVKKYAADCVVTTNPQTFTHGLATGDLTVTVWEGTTQVYPDVTKTSTTSVTVDWGAAPTAAQYRVVVHG